MEKTYSSWMTWENPSKQREYLQETQLLDQDGTLLTSGWAKKNVFKYDRDRVKHVMRRKEWDFYQISKVMTFIPWVSTRFIPVSGKLSCSKAPLTALIQTLIFSKQKTSFEEFSVMSSGTI